MWLQKAADGDSEDDEYRAICVYGDPEAEEQQWRLEHSFKIWRLEQEEEGEEEEEEDCELELD